MDAPLFHSAALAVLEHYPAPVHGPIIPLGNRGGFSGAKLWKVGEHCLRRWPTDGTSASRLRWIHRLMIVARDAQLSFVPLVQKSRDGDSCVESESHCWDLTSWQPGCADFHARPTAEKLVAACTAIAQVHAAWRPIQPERGSLPAIQRRLQRLAEWQELVVSRWRPNFAPPETDPVTPWAVRGWHVLPIRMNRLLHSLLAWQERPFPLQPCLCDVWHDHVLFDGENLTGLVDYGSVRVDHLATDLARLLGSLVGDDDGSWETGLTAYCTQLRLTEEEILLTRVLDRSGTLLGAANWLRWLYHERRPYADREAVAGRLAKLVERIERWD